MKYRLHMPLKKRLYFSDYFTDHNISFAPCTQNIECLRRRVDA